MVAVPSRCSDSGIGAVLFAPRSKRRKAALGEQLGCVLSSDSASFRDASSTNSPSNRAACVAASRSRFARSRSAGDGVKMRLTGSIWLGWITHLPS